MTEKTLTTENIRPALDALRGELAPWPVVAKKQDRLNTAQLNAANSGITSSLVAQIIANTAAIRALESAITGTGLRALVVSSLPAIGTQGILYIVPVTTYDPETDADVVNYSNEYLWIPVEGGTASEGHYEQVGQTGIVINNGQLTITVNGTSVGTFTANQSGDTTAAITVPTNADYVDRTTDQTVAGVKTFSSTINGTAAKAIADEDGTSIKTGYGKLAGSQTWSGINTYNDGIYTKTGFRAINDSYSSGTPSANIFYSALAYGGLVSNTFTRSFSIDGAIRTTGYNDLSLRVYSQTGEVLSGVLIESNATASDIAFRPLINGTHKLGSSSYQWSSVYAQTYYYNGTAWGLDKANVWSDINIFTNVIAYKDTVAEIGNYPASNRIKYQTFADKNGTTLGYTNFAVATNGVTSWNLWLENKATNGVLSPTGTQIKSFISLYIDTDMSSKLKLYGDFFPNNTNRFDLGTSTNKWRTLNGVNPGALSLPDLNSDGYVDLSGNISANTQYTYTAPSDGWLCLYVQTSGFHAENAVAIFNGAGTTDSHRWANSATSSINLLRMGVYHGAVSVPVRSGNTYFCYVNIDSSTSLSRTFFYFYKAQGNV